MIITYKDINENINFEVFFDGKNLTKECFYVDTNGIIKIYCKDKNSHYFYDESGEIVFTELRGKVEIHMIRDNEVITDLEKIESILIMEKLTK